VQVPRFEPFPALRYSPTLALDDVTAPPYDVLSDSDVDALLARHPCNIVAVDVPRETGGADRYAAAATKLQQWITDGTIVRDAEPAFTLYRMNFNDASGRTRETVGVLGGLEVVDEGDSGVLPHERTTPKAKSDRLDLTRATITNLSPVWGLSLRQGLTDLLRDTAEVVGCCHDEQGVLHTVERITAPHRIAAISAAVGAESVLIADGHHRYAIARTFRDEVRGEHGNDTPAELTLTYVAELVEEQLAVDAIHRLYHGISADDLLALLAPYFEASPGGTVTAATTTEMATRGALCLVRPDGSGVWLAPRAAALAGARDLDGEYLERALAGRDITVSYQHGVRQVLDLVATGHAGAAVLIRPTTIAEIRRTAAERLLMPPKSTFFTPKLRTGLVLRPLDL
jgi:uncharacterized protein (DUF1015 family)